MKKSYSSINIITSILLIILFALILMGNSFLHPLTDKPGEGINLNNSLSSQNTPTPIPIPVEIEKNRSQTQGIVVGVAVLVLIIISGTMIGITRK